MQNQNTRRGFTLIELLVVVLIISILAVVAVPQYNKAVKKAHGTEVTNAVKALDKALEVYYLENGTYHGIDPDTLALNMPSLHHFRYQAGSPDGYDTGSSQFNSIRFSGPEQINVSFFPPKKEMSVLATWKNGKFTSAMCLGGGGGGQNRSDVSCNEYFNCKNDLQEVTRQIQVFSYYNGENHVSYQNYSYWEGAECNLF